VIAAVFAILNADITTVNVALVTLGKDLHADLKDLQWGLNIRNPVIIRATEAFGTTWCS